jgi:hypothetical protein
MSTRLTLQTQFVPGPAEEREVTGSTPVPTTVNVQFRCSFWGARSTIGLSQNSPKKGTAMPLNQS